MADEQVKECPYCGGEVNEGAVKCKHCGEFLNKREGVDLINEAKKFKLTDSQKIILTKMLHVLGMVGAIIFALFGCGVLFQSEIVIIDATICIAEWAAAIFFLLLWKYTE